jgi:hypothetical protein
MLSCPPIDIRKELPNKRLQPTAAGTVCTGLGRPPLDSVTGSSSWLWPLCVFQQLSLWRLFPWAH